MIDRLKLAVSVQILRHLSLYFKPIWKATAKKEIKPGSSTCRDSGSISSRDQVSLYCSVVYLLLFGGDGGGIEVGFPVGSKWDPSAVLNDKPANHTVKIWNIWDNSCNDCPTLKVFIEWTVRKQLHVSSQFL